MSRVISPPLRTKGKGRQFIIRKRNNHHRHNNSNIKASLQAAHVHAALRKAHLVGSARNGVSPASARLVRLHLDKAAVSLRKSPRSNLAGQREAACERSAVRLEGGAAQAVATWNRELSED